MEVKGVIQCVETLEKPVRIAFFVIYIHLLIAAISVLFRSGILNEDIVREI